jgi:ComF family protein
MKGILKYLSNAILPHQCILCRQFAQRTGLCASCWSGLVTISEPMCVCCGRALAHAHPQSKCGACWLLPPPVAKIRAWCVYNDTSRAMILKFKHGDGLMLTPIFTTAMARHYDQLVGADTLVIPVPLHRWRYLRRRYNQSGELARNLVASQPQGSFTPNILTRRKPTSSQAGLTRAQRRQNLAGAFHVNEASKTQLRGRPVLLIDDVLTTGATVMEAAKTLIRAGSGEVTALVIARVG